MDSSREKVDQVSEPFEGNLRQRQSLGKEAMVDDKTIVMPAEGSSTSVARNMNVGHLLPEERQNVHGVDEIAIEMTSISSISSPEVQSPLVTVQTAQEIPDEISDWDSDYTWGFDYSALVRHLEDSTPLQPLELWKEVRIIYRSKKRFCWACSCVFFGILHVSLIYLLTYHPHYFDSVRQPQGKYMTGQVHGYVYTFFIILYLAIYIFSPVPLVSTEVFSILVGMTMSPLAAFVTSIMVTSVGNVALIGSLMSTYSSHFPSMGYLRLCLDLKRSVFSAMIQTNSALTAELLRYTPLPAFTLAPLLALSTQHYVCATLVRGLSVQIMYTYIGMSRKWSSREHVKSLGSAVLSCQLIVGPIILAVFYWKARQAMINQFSAHQARQESEAARFSQPSLASPRDSSFSH